MGKPLDRFENQSKGDLKWLVQLCGDMDTNRTDIYQHERQVEWVSTLFSTVYYKGLRTEYNGLVYDDNVTIGFYNFNSGVPEQLVTSKDCPVYQGKKEPSYEL